MKKAVIILRHLVARLVNGDHAGGQHAGRGLRDRGSQDGEAGEAACGLLD